MNKFVIVEEFIRYNKVTYYTVRVEDSEFSETDKFFNKMEVLVELQSDLLHFVEWMRIIGEEEGALENYFRPESRALALPPPFRYIETHLRMRLYCYRVSNEIVILFNGGLKTTEKAQDCKNVSIHFYNAQKWTKELIEIRIEHIGKSIVNLDDLILKY